MKQQSEGLKWLGKEACLAWRHASVIARGTKCKDSNTVGTNPAMESKCVRPVGRR
jgi:hypothetical protein